MAFLVKTLHKYLLRCVLRPFLLAALFLAFLFLSLRLLRFARLIVDRGLGLVDLLSISGYLVPAFLELVVPLALYVAVASTIVRLRADGEITALYALGLRSRSILAPLAVVAAALALLTLPLAVHVRPWALRSLQMYVAQRVTERPSLGIQEKVFLAPSPGVVLYVHSIRAGGQDLQGVLLADSRSREKKEVVIARAGWLDPEAQGGALLLRLYDGFVHTVDKRADRVETITFKQFDWRLAARTASQGAHIGRPQEMSWQEIRLASRGDDHDSVVREPSRSVRLEMFRRATSPLGCVVFFVASLFPLNLPIRTSYGAVAGLLGLLVLGYYTSQTAAEVLTMQGVFPPLVGAVFPYFVLGALIATGVFVSRGQTR